MEEQPSGHIPCLQPSLHRTENSAWNKEETVGTENNVERPQICVYICIFKKICRSLYCISNVNVYLEGIIHRILVRRKKRSLLSVSELRVDVVALSRRVPVQEELGPLRVEIGVIEDRHEAVRLGGGGG